MRLYPIARPESGSAPEDSVDFQGSFRIGFNAEEQILYLAVEVQDESTVIDATATAAWNTQDGCEVYVDVRHEEQYSPAVQHALRGDPAEGGNARVQRVGTGTGTNGKSS